VQGSNTAGQSDRVFSVFEDRELALESELVGARVPSVPDQLIVDASSGSAYELAITIGVRIAPEPASI
jgi:hypothetical protein